MYNAANSAFAGWFGSGQWCLGVMTARSARTVVSWCDDTCLQRGAANAITYNTVVSACSGGLMNTIAAQRQSSRTCRVTATITTTTATTTAIANTAIAHIAATTTATTTRTTTMDNDDDDDHDFNDVVIYV